MAEREPDLLNTVYKTISERLVMEAAMEIHRMLIIRNTKTQSF